jgi:hypothetical protein
MCAPRPWLSLSSAHLGVRRVTIDTPNGTFWFDPINFLGMDLSSRGIYEPGMLKTIAKYLPPGGTFIDIGANEGYFRPVAVLSGLTRQSGLTA